MWMNSTDLSYGSKLCPWVNVSWTAALTCSLFLIKYQGMDNTYIVCSVWPPGSKVFHGLPPDHRTTFTTTDQRLGLPDPRFLKLHEAVCKVVHRSGMDRYLHHRDYKIRMKNEETREAELSGRLESLSPNPLGL